MSAADWWDAERQAKREQEAADYSRRSLILEPLVAKHLNVEALLNELNQLLHRHRLPSDEVNELKWHLKHAVMDLVMNSNKFLGGDPDDPQTPVNCPVCHSHCLQPQAERQSQ